MSELTFGMRLTYDGKSAVVGMDETRAKMEGISTAGAKMSAQYSNAAMSSKQLSMATRQLPMQFTDIFTSLAAGQSPMMVLLQQGGQIKDQFGGVGNAAKAMGGYIFGMINPITLTTAAVAAGAAAWYYWGSEAENAADKAVAASKKATDGMRDTDALYILFREREKLSKKIPIQWLSYDDKDLQKLDDDAQKLIAEFKRLEDQIKKKAQTSDASWASFHATLAEQKDAELKRLKQGYDNQVVLAQGSQNKLLTLEKEFRQKKADIELEFDEKANKNKARNDGTQILIGLEREYQAELEKRKEAMASPLLTESQRSLNEAMRQASKQAQDARIELEKLHATKNGISDTDYANRLAEITAKEREQLAAVRQLQEAQNRLNASWEYGAQIAMRKYQDEASNTAAQTERAFSSSMHSMENAEIDFIRKNKADWRSLGDAIIAELLRIMVAKFNAGIVGNISGMFNTQPAAPIVDATTMPGRRAAGGPVSANSLYRVNERGPELLNYGGEDYLMMGGNGGYVKPLGSEGGGSGGGSNVSVVINNHSGQPATTREATDSRGNRSIEVVIGDLAASELARPGSSMHRTMRTSFGAQPAMVHR